MAKRSGKPGRPAKETPDAKHPTSHPQAPIVPAAAVDPLTGLPDAVVSAATVRRGVGNGPKGEPAKDAEKIPNFIDGKGKAWAVTLADSGLPTFVVMADTELEAKQRFIDHNGIISTKKVLSAVPATDPKGRHVDRKGAMNVARASTQKENPGQGMDGGDPSGPFRGGRFQPVAFDGSDNSDLDRELNPLANPEDAENGDDEHDDE